MTRHVIIACDPGAHGAFAVLVDGHLAEIEDMPTLTATVSGKNRQRVSDDLVDGVLRSLLTSFVGPLDEVTFVIEEVGALPKDGSVQAFAFGCGWGIVRGVATGLRIPKVYVAPQIWKRAMKLRRDKDASRKMAMELWPAHREKFARVRDDGRAEAALIGLWYYRNGGK